MKTSAQLATLAEEVARLEDDMAVLRQRHSVELQPIDDIATVVREARARQGLSQRGLADLADVSQATVVALETRTRSAQMAPLLRILSALGLTLYVGGKG